MALDPSASVPRAPRPSRRAWVRPVVADLPRLTELTLASPDGGVSGGGGPGGGGSTVIF
ncbi:MAG TPA: hypothetical protein VF746_12160 [Longimicrobium sp.]|jgi:hypothetical protein